MEPLKIKPRIKKSVKTDNQPVELASGERFVPLKVETEQDAMRACLHMILKHSADMFVTICEIVAEEYKLDQVKMVETIRGSPRFEKLCSEDVLLTMGYLGEPAPCDKGDPPKSSEAPAAESVAAVEKPKRKPRAPKAAPVQAPVVVVQEEASPPPPPPAAAPVKKMKVRIVNKA
jgi:hypothetical protein